MFVSDIKNVSYVTKYLYIYRELDFEDVFNVVEEKYCSKMSVQRRNELTIFNNRVKQN